MKRVLQIGSLALLALLIVQPAMAALACGPLAGPEMASTQAGMFSQMATSTMQEQNSCCNVDAPDSTQQALVDRFTQAPVIGDGVMEQPTAWMVLPAQHTVEPDRALPPPLPAASLQSLYCTFMN